MSAWLLLQFLVLELLLRMLRNGELQRILSTLLIFSYRFSLIVQSRGVVLRSDLSLSFFMILRQIGGLLTLCITLAFCLLLFLIDLFLLESLLLFLSLFLKPLLLLLLGELLLL